MQTALDIRVNNSDNETDNSDNTGWAECEQSIIFCYGGAALFDVLTHGAELMVVIWDQLRSESTATYAETNTATRGFERLHDPTRLANK